MIEKIAEDLINKMPTEEKVSLMRRSLDLAKRTAGATWRGAKAGAGLAWEGTKMTGRFAAKHPYLTAAGLAGAGLYHINQGAQGAYDAEMTNQLEDVMSRVDAARTELMEDPTKVRLHPRQYNRMKNLYDSGTLHYSAPGGSDIHYGQQLWHENLKTLDAIIGDMPADLPKDDFMRDYYADVDKLYRARNSRSNEILTRYQDMLTGKPAMGRMQDAAAKAKGDFLKQTFLRRAAAPIVNVIPKVEAAVSGGVNAVKGAYGNAKALLDLYEHGKGLQYKIPKPKLF